jgi:hypothetical protein
LLDVLAEGNPSHHFLGRPVEKAVLVRRVAPAMA